MGEKKVEERGGNGLTAIVVELAEPDRRGVLSEIFGALRIVDIEEEAQTAKLTDVPVDLYQMDDKP